MLIKKCNKCGVILTEENGRKRKETKDGYRPECKLCRNKYERKRYDAQDKRCEGCGILCWAKGKRFFCSINCRFKVYYAINPLTNCWEWIGKIGKDGYGRFVIGKKRCIASRISYELHNKIKIDKNFMICHSCDNTKCVNPEHLWLGTNQDNQIDAVEKRKLLSIGPVINYKFY